LGEARGIGVSNELDCIMNSYKKILLNGFEGECMEAISVDKLKAFLKWPDCARDWKLLRRVSSHGTYTYQVKADLGLGESEYFIKVFRKQERFEVAWKKMKSIRGLKKPWRYPLQMLGYLFDPIPVKVGFEKGKALLEQGIPTALPVAYLYQKGLISAWGFIITEKIPNIIAENLAEYLKQRKNELGSGEYIREKRALILELAKLFGKLMTLDFFLPDLRVSNILVERLPEGKFKLWVIDVVEAIPHKPREDKMLYHLIANPYYAQLFTGTDKIRFLKWYLGFSGRAESWSIICCRVNPLLQAWWKKWHKKYGQQNPKPH